MSINTTFKKMILKKKARTTFTTSTAQYIGFPS
jgi:hypothetical protein